jgi:hypothetical protein
MRRLLAVLVVLALEGCGAKTVTSTEGPPTTQAPVAAQAPPPTCAQQVQSWLATDDTDAVDGDSATIQYWLTQLTSELDLGETTNTSNPQADDFTGISEYGTLLVNPTAAPAPTCADPQGLFAAFANDAANVTNTQTDIQAVMAFNQFTSEVENNTGVQIT